MASHDLTLKPFTVPNFAVFDKGNRDKTITDGCVPIEELSEDALFELCEDFVRQAFKKAGKKAGKNAPGLVKMKKYEID